MEDSWAKGILILELDGRKKERQKSLEDICRMAKEKGRKKNLDYHTVHCAWVFMMVYYMGFLFFFLMLGISIFSLGSESTRFLHCVYI